MKTIDDFAECAERLKALADGERLRILQALFCGSKNVSEITAELRGDLVNISHHLGVLRRAKIVKSQRQGRFVVYTLNPAVAAANSNSHELRQIDLGCCRLNIER